MSFDGFTDGFSHRAEQTWDHKGETALALLASSGLGQAFAYARNNPELVGTAGRVFGKWGPTALLAVCAADLVRRVATAPDSKSATSVLGEFAFDTALGGAIGLGTYRLANTSAMSKTFGTRPLTEVPASVKLSIHDDVALLENARFQPPFQVRLSNGKGFVYNNSGESVKLMEMPTKLADGTTLKYTPEATHIQRPNGFAFTQYADGSLEYEQAGLTMRQFRNGSLRTTDGAGNVTNYRAGDWQRITSSGDSVYFNPATQRTELIDKTGWRTSWQGDDFTGMRSALGRHEVVQGQEGLLYKFTYGTDRWLRRNMPARVDEVKLGQIAPGQTRLDLRGTSVDLRRPIIEPPPLFDASLQPVI